MSDRNYLFLLSHLYRPTTSLPLPTIQASIAHYLAYQSQSPTPLIASIVSSPLFQPFSYAKLEALCAAFRHSVHIKVKLLREDERGLFARSLHSRLGDWLKAMVEGFRSGHPTLKLVCYGGLLLGIEDWEHDLHLGNGTVRRIVEEEIVIALAEVIDMYSYVKWPADWAKDLSESEDGDEPLSLSLLLSSRFIHLLSMSRLETLPLPIISDLLMSTIESAYDGGQFLSSLNTSIDRDSYGKLNISPSSVFARDLSSLSSSKFMAAMATLAKCCSRMMSVLTESRPTYGWPAMIQAMSHLERIARNIEGGWIVSPLASVSGEDDIASESQSLIAQMWNILKTEMFTTVMLSQSILSIVTFVPPLPSSTGAAPPFALATAVLRTLSHLSFVIQQFGGVTSTSEAGFPELKRTFYTALDVLSANAAESEQFVQGLTMSAGSHDSTPETHIRTKTAFKLACVEQLVPALSDKCIRDNVFYLCSPHLSAPDHRETYESAHSVMLAVFASYAQKAEPQHTTADAVSAFAEEIVPFYTRCLLQNSGEGGLSISQLCLAYAALVRGASAFGRKKALHVESRDDGDVYAWYCIETLLDAIRDVSSSADKQRLHRLHLALISCLSSASLSLLPRILEENRKIVCETQTDAEQSTERVELVQALFKEISENVGDAEKEYCMRWWYSNRDELVGHQPNGGNPHGVSLVARL